MKKVFIPILLIISIFLIYFQLNQTELLLVEKTIVYQAEIRGEVLKPGIYTIESEETLQTLIDKAGGLSEKADTSTLSLQRKILHEEMIVIPKITEVEKISLNSASKEKLMTLPGIGESKAEKIIEYRSQQSFKSLEDIMNVKGIGEKIFEKLKEHICL